MLVADGDAPVDSVGVPHGERASDAVALGVEPRLSEGVALPVREAVGVELTRVPVLLGVEPRLSVGVPHSDRVTDAEARERLAVADDDGDAPRLSVAELLLLRVAVGETLTREPVADGVAPRLNDDVAEREREAVVLRGEGGACCWRRPARAQRGPRPAHLPLPRAAAAKHSRARGRGRRPSGCRRSARPRLRENARRAQQRAHQRRAQRAGHGRHMRSRTVRCARV